MSTGPTDGWLSTVRATSRTRLVLYVLLVGLLAFFLLPIETGLMTAIKTGEAFRKTLPYVPPSLTGFTLGPAKSAFDELAPKMVNSFIVVIPATILSALFGSMAAYGLTTLSWRNQLGLVVLFVAGVFIPYQAVLVPLSRFWSIVDPAVFWHSIVGLGPEQTARFTDLTAITITHTAYGIPITTVLFRSYYQGFSDEMIEAARLDGASAYSIYRNIMLPLSVPMFAVTLIYQFTQVWNDLLFALVLVNQPNAKLVTQGLANLSGGMIQTFNTQMAGALIAALPTILVYIAFGDKFARGVAGES